MIAADDGVALDAALGEWEVAMRTDPVHGNRGTSFGPVEYQRHVEDRPAQRFAAHSTCKCRDLPTILDELAITAERVHPRSHCHWLAASAIDEQFPNNQ